MLDRTSHLMGYHGRYRRLPESWRSIEEDMLERRFPDLRAIDGDLEMLLHRTLSDIFSEGSWA